MRAIAAYWPALIIGSRSHIAGMLSVTPTEDNEAAGREFVEKHSELNGELDLAKREIKNEISTVFRGSREGMSQWHKIPLKLGI